MLIINPWLSGRQWGKNLTASVVGEPDPGQPRACEPGKLTKSICFSKAGSPIGHLPYTRGSNPGGPNNYTGGGKLLGQGIGPIRFQLHSAIGAKKPSVEILEAARMAEQ